MSPWGGSNFKVVPMRAKRQKKNRCDATFLPQIWSLSGSQNDSMYNLLLSKKTKTKSIDIYVALQALKVTQLEIVQVSLLCAHINPIECNNNCITIKQNKAKNRKNDHRYRLTLWEERSSRPKATKYLFLIVAITKSFSALLWVRSYCPKPSHLVLFSNSIFL